MDNTQDKLTQLRRRAEAALKDVVDTPHIAIENIDEVVHELNVYHVELEIQLEDLQQSYRALETAQERYASLFDFAPVGYIVTDMQGIVINANLTGSSMLGVEREALENTPFAEFITMDFQDIYHLHRRAVLHTRQAQACEVQLQRADSTIFYAQLNTDLPDHHSETMRTAITNISTIKQEEAALHRALAREMEINQLQTRVLSVIGHEFRTPLAVILSAMEILERYSDRLTDEKRQQHYQTIRNFVWYLNDMVQDTSSIQDFDDQLDLKLNEFDVLAFMRQLINDVERMAQNGQEIVLDIVAQYEKESVNWDQKLFRRILMNLLNNALKYSEKAVRCHLECKKSIICLRVEDQGGGISEEDQQHMYEPFYRGKNVEFIHGTGIGLFVVQRAVQAHGGTIRCESRLGQGATFIVELPRQVLVPPA